MDRISKNALCNYQLIVCFDQNKIGREHIRTNEHASLEGQHHPMSKCKQ